MSMVAVEVGVIFLLILVNGALALSEIAVVSARKARLQRLANSGHSGAAAALQLANSPDVFLSTVQVGITLVGVFAGAFGGATLAEEIAGWLSQYPPLAAYGEAIGVGIVVIAITYFSLVLGELAPKRVALNNPERMASLVARPMNSLARMTSPVVRFLSASTNFILRVLRIRPSAEPPVTEEEIKILVDQGTRAGVFDPAERDLVSRIFRLGDRTVDMLMTQRSDIVWLEMQDTPALLLQKIAKSEHSRYPVHEGSTENVQGLVVVRDLLQQSLEGKEINLRGALRPPLYVPEGSRAVDLVQKFRERRTHIALVVDEHGSVAGVCTLHDILEALVGDLATGAHHDRAASRQRDDGSWLLDGMLPVDELKEMLRLTQLPGEEAGDYHTLGGFVMKILRKIPAEGDHFDVAGLTFEVVDMDGRRVDKVLVHGAQPPVK